MTSKPNKQTQVLIESFLGDANPASRLESNTANTEAEVEQMERVLEAYEHSYHQFRYAQLLMLQEDPNKRLNVGLRKHGVNFFVRYAANLRGMLRLEEFPRELVVCVMMGDTRLKGMAMNLIKEIDPSLYLPFVRNIVFQKADLLDYDSLYGLISLMKFMNDENIENELKNIVGNSQDEEVLGMLEFFDRVAE